MKKFMKSFRDVLMLVLCLVLAMNLLLFGTSFFAREDSPKLFGYAQRVVVDSDVSVPAASEGDMLIFKEGVEYQENDIVICNHDGTVYTCRIIGEAQNGYIARCESNPLIDGSEIRQDQIMGKMVVVLPGIGNVISVMQSVPGVIVILVLGFLLLETPKFVEYLSRKRRHEYIAY